MVDGVKPYTLPQGLINLYDPSAAEQQYIAGIARAGTPAGLLQMGMNDTRAQREAGIAQLLGLNEDIQGRTDKLNSSLIDADRFKQLLGAYTDMAKAENPAIAEAFAPLALNIAPYLRLPQEGASALASRGLDAGARRDANDQSKRFENFGTGAERSRNAGFTPPRTGGLTIEQLMGAKQVPVTPLSLEREAVQQAGQNSRADKAKFEVQLDDAGNEIGRRVVGGSAAAAMAGAEQLRTGAGGKPPVTRTDARNAQESTLPGKENAQTAYGGVSMPKSHEAEAKLIESGNSKDPKFAGLKPIGGDRWTQNDLGNSRLMVDAIGQKWRVILSPNPRDPLGPPIKQRRRVPPIVSGAQQ